MLASIIYEETLSGGATPYKTPPRNVFKTEGDLYRDNLKKSKKKPNKLKIDVQTSIQDDNISIDKDVSISIDTPLLEDISLPIEIKSSSNESSLLNTHLLQAKILIAKAVERQRNDEEIFIMLLLALNET